APVPAAVRSRPYGDEEVRRLRREDDVRQEDRRRDPVDRRDRSGRHGEEALGAGRQCRGASREGARGVAERRLSPRHSRTSRQVGGCEKWWMTPSLQYFCDIASATRVAASGAGWQRTWSKCLPATVTPTSGALLLFSTRSVERSPRRT